ncbi:hypothetical protein BpHYR1_018518 [Brachionus plicatilis]|uniref:Uncharacterized protein n=1 Tax=Brachionus plicatilis TaxID=10195 RepID=A0A3M7PBV0_BRAPC|nr:hypothetical protein BpHYR1_018518 [Brachionus plicatilis]
MYRLPNKIYEKLIVNNLPFNIVNSEEFQEKRDIKEINEKNLIKFSKKFQRCKKIISNTEIRTFDKNFEINEHLKQEIEKFKKRHGFFNLDKPKSGLEKAKILSQNLKFWLCLFIIHVREYFLNDQFFLKLKSSLKLSEALIYLNENEKTCDQKNT